MSSTKKTATIFDHLNNISALKTKWEMLSEPDKKTFSPYLINRFLSMNPDMIEFVNELQKYTIGILAPKEVYNLYLEILPKKKMFLKYIKGDSKEKYPEKVIECVSKYYEFGRREAIECLDVLSATPEFKVHIESILKAFSLSEKEIKKLI